MYPGFSKLLRYLIELTKSCKSLILLNLYNYTQKINKLKSNGYFLTEERTIADVCYIIICSINYCLFVRCHNLVLIIWPEFNGRSHAWVECEIVSYHSNRNNN